MNIETVMQYVTYALILSGILAFLTSLIVQVIKELPGIKNIQTNVVALIVAAILCIVAMLLLCTYYKMPVLWYYVVAALITAFIVYTSETKTTMCGAIKYCLEKLIAYSPTTPILIFLPPQRAEGNSEQKNRNELIKQICEIYSVKTKDLYNESQIIPNTVVEGSNNLSDGLHFAENGYVNAGRVMSSSILKLMGY